jgi:type VI secretion system protein ImpE
MSTSTTPTQSFTAFLQGQTLQGALMRAQDLVKHKPADVTARWGLFELLCVLSDWQRALKQLQICVKLDPSLEHTAQMLRDLIAASVLRKQVWLGEQQPVPVVDLPPWMADLAMALAHHARGQTTDEDAARHAAFAAAPLAAGQFVLRSGESHAFDFITDTDTRLGPVCEVMVAGSYRWLAFSDIASIKLNAPKKLLDLVWLPVQMVLHHSPLDMNAFIPSRYQELLPLADTGEANADAGAGDALLLARQTQWQEMGETGVYAQGQKTWMTSQAQDGGRPLQCDHPMFDVERITFHKNSHREEETS